MLAQRGRRHLDGRRGSASGGDDQCRVALARLCLLGFSTSGVGISLSADRGGQRRELVAGGRRFGVTDPWQAELVGRSMYAR
jgi:hypothetical protein